MKRLLRAALYSAVLLGMAVLVPFHHDAEAAALPAKVAIPAIRLAVRVRAVGSASDGSMAVPAAADTVGWYAGGTVPGAQGSAVFDAHVYLAFKNLRYVRPGDRIYVTAADGSVRTFAVAEVATYTDAAVPLAAIFTAADAAHLNLITCAGTWLPGQGTYSKRLVVYATAL